MPPATPPPAPSRPFPQAEVIALPGEAPEDIVVGADGFLYCGVSGGAILRIDATSAAATEVATTGGRPLGLEALPDGRLLVCDADRGLLRVDPATGSVHTLVQQVAGRSLRFCSNVVALADGTIWFTQSTTRFPFAHYTGSFLEHRPSGRLLRLDTDGSVDVVLDDLYFANGVAATPDASGLILLETAAYRVSRVEAAGPDAGVRRVLADNLPGFPDNLSTFVNGRAWLGMTNPRSAFLDKAGTLPGWMRQVAWRLPDRLQPRPRDIVWLRAIDTHGTVVEDLHTVRTDFRMVTAVVEHRSHLYAVGIAQAALLRLPFTH